MRSQNMAKSNTELLFENANAGFKAFEEKMLGMSKQQIFDEAYEINAKNEIHGFLCDCAVDDLSEEEIEVLLSYGDTVIEELYLRFQDVDNASIMFYSDILEWVQDFCQEVLNSEV